MKLNNFFINIGLKVFAKWLNEYLSSNNPNDENRDLLKELFDKFPEFKIKTKIYRASRVDKNFPRDLKNKFVGGCRSFKDIDSFIKKRYDKGYKYILESKEAIECFDLSAFIRFINKKYGKYINEFYQDENEIIFLFKYPYTWFNAKKIS